LRFTFAISNFVPSNWKIINMFKQGKRGIPPVGNWAAMATRA
jgi:hypothetical protein